MPRKLEGHMGEGAAQPRAPVQASSSALQRRAGGVRWACPRSGLFHGDSSPIPRASIPPSGAPRWLSAALPNAQKNGTVEGRGGWSRQVSAGLEPQDPALGNAAPMGSSACIQPLACPAQRPPLSEISSGCPVPTWAGRPVGHETPTPAGSPHAVVRGHVLGCHFPPSHLFS